MVQKVQEKSAREVFHGLVSEIQEYRNKLHGYSFGKESFKGLVVFDVEDTDYGPQSLLVNEAFDRIKQGFGYKIPSQLERFYRLADRLFEIIDVQGALIEKHEKAFKILAEIDFKDFGFKSESDEKIVGLQEQIELLKSDNAKLFSKLKDLGSSPEAPVSISQKVVDERPVSDKSSPGSDDIGI